jgi:type I restriction enzyme S subunit
MTLEVREVQRSVPLQEICTRISSGGTPSRKHPEFFENGDHLWVKSQELRDGSIHSTEEHITDEALANSSAKLYPENTVLLAMYGATVGQLGLLKGSAHKLL